MFSVRNWTGISLACLALAATGCDAAAASRFVANDGVDSLACGGSATPCRSIAQAIANAKAGDVINVRPGAYGTDLDWDGVFNEPGEEPANGIIISKRLTVQSTDGAAGTFLGHPNPGASVVTISAPDVVFGKRNRGFTISLREGLAGVLIPSGSDRASVSGIVVSITPGSASGGPIGFVVFGNDAKLSDNRVIGYNVSDQNVTADFGFFTFGAHTLLDRNSVQAAQHCFVLAGTDAVVTRNLAIGCLVDAFNLSNYAAFTGNAALANSGAGLVVYSGTGPISGNTFAGNGLSGSNANCGMVNNSNGALVATNNYWGAATGPGAEPADQICNGFGSSTTTSPHATKETIPLQSPLR